MKKSLLIKRTAHYHIQEGKSADHILYIIHGYGQLASEFIEEFKCLKDQAVVVIAPEAISKFYNKDRKAVANWMTSHEREDEIIDYINYLNDLHQKISNTYQAKDYSILGFSQGTSTALRWMKATDLAFKNAYICSGSIPPEIKNGDLDKQSACHFNYFYGDNDRFIDEEKAAALMNNFQSLVKNLKVVPFHGKHIVSEECKDQIIENLN